MSAIKLPEKARLQTWGNIDSIRGREALFVERESRERETIGGMISPKVDLALAKRMVEADAVKLGYFDQETAKWCAVELTALISGQKIDEVGFGDNDGDGKQDVYFSYQTSSPGGSLEKRVSWIHNTEIMEAVESKLSRKEVLGKK